MNKLEGNVFKAYYHQYFFDEEDVDLFNPTIEHWIFELHFIKSDAKDNWVYQTMITEEKTLSMDQYYDPDTVADIMVEKILDLYDENEIKDWMEDPSVIHKIIFKRLSK